MNNLNMKQPVPQAQLWAGDHERLVTKLDDYLITQLCPNKGCKNCSVCRNVRARQHHTCMWLVPENNYTLDDIRPIQTTMALSLDEGQQYFFILYKADRLTAACANSLLKSVEEPPRGYHFIFLTERPENVLPTIQSRCTIYTLYSAKNSSLHGHPFYTLFTTAITHSPNVFVKELDSSPPTERESIELVDNILAYWLAESKNNALEHRPQRYTHAQRNITILLKALTKPPMPGSSKIFWKNLFLQIKMTR
jgi:DNA polymerase-3 subunit delta'